MIKTLLQNRVNALESITNNDTINYIKKVAETIISCKLNGKKILICGNGGSASQASHFATELMGKYKGNCSNHFALSLCADSSLLTALSNDFSFEKIFSSQIETIAQPGDILIIISSSGNSQNLINAIKIANDKQLSVFALLGKGGGIIKTLVEASYIDNSMDTAIVQEHHLTIIHLICECLDVYEDKL